MSRSPERIILICEECGEKLIVRGPEADWRSRCAIFVCECGHKLTLDGRADEEVLTAS
jgi:predicted RNA-binding Zn-ribbon protein involved in translation (DUF1610 family)